MTTGSFTADLSAQAMSLAQQAIRRGDYLAAREGLTELIAADTANAEAFFWLGRLAGLEGRFSEEMEMTRRALDIVPHQADYLAQLAKGYCRQHDARQAIACAEVAELTACTDLTLDAVASVYTRLGLHEKAATLLRRAAEMSSNPAIFFNLGTALKFCGAFDEARTSFERAITLSPAYHKAHAALTSLGGLSAAHNHTDRLNRLIAETSDPRALIHLYHALAKEYEALGRFDEAFQALQTGKAGLRRQINYNFASDEALFQELTNNFNRAAEPSVGFDSDAPIFVVGMPRSGTTLVDRILSGHTDVASVGESSQFGQLLRRACASRSRHLLDVADITVADRLHNYQALGADYIRSADHLRSHAPRFVDKFHMNIWLVGFIARALPKARFVCLIRNPLDTIVGNYRQLFEFNTPLYNYSLTLEDTARFYLRFRQLANLWQRILPDRFCSVNYEQLVASPEAEARSMLTFCGLSWQDQCLRIEDNASPVATASSVQVRQPINADSLGRWKHYEAHLDKVKAIVDPARLSRFDQLNRAEFAGGSLGHRLITL